MGEYCSPATIRGASVCAPQGSEWAPGIEGIQRRARLYLARLPPDQLNPRGHYDAALRPVYDRATRKRRHAGPPGDPRLSALPLELPPLGAALCRTLILDPPPF